MEKRLRDLDLLLLACILNPFSRHGSYLTAEQKFKAIDLLCMDALRNEDLESAHYLLKEKKDEVKFIIFDWWFCH